MPDPIHIIMGEFFQFEPELVGRDLAAVGAGLRVDCWGRKLHLSAG